MYYKFKLILTVLIFSSFLAAGISYYSSNLKLNPAKAGVSNSLISDLNTSTSRDNNIVPDEYILKLREGFDSTSLNLTNSKNENLAVKQKLGEQTFLVSNPSNQLKDKTLAEIVKASDLGQIEIKNENKQTLDTVKELSKNNNIENVEPNGIIKLDSIPNDPLFPSQWHHQNNGQSTGTVGKDIKTPQAFDINQGSSSVVVAIIDSGIDLNHPDLVNNIYKNSSNQVIGYDFVNSDNNPTDDNGHGTHVSGIVAAQGNNNMGVTGVCPNCKIMPVKFMDSSGNGTTANGINAINYAAANGAKIINLSWGSSGYSATLQDAINNAHSVGISVVASSGNENVSDFQFPSDMNNVISVSATDRNDLKANFSNYNERITVSAPGVEILSTFPPGVNKSGLCGDSTLAPNNDGYGYCTGTSMSSPVVAGLAGLVSSQFPTYTADQIAAKIITSSDSIDNLNPGYKGLLGSGRVNAFRALSEPLVPSFSFNEVNITDPNANNNSLAEPSEQINFNIKILNLGESANSVSGILSTSDPDILITQSNSSFTNVNFAQIQSGSFSLTLNQNMVLPKSINFSLEISSAGFASQIISFSHTFKNSLDLSKSFSFDSNAQDWTSTGIWKLSQNCFANTTLETPKYFHFGKDNCGDYDFNLRMVGSLYSPPIKIQTGQVSFSFDQFLETENQPNSYDKATVKIKRFGSSDNTATTLFSAQNNTTSWINSQINLPTSITSAGLFQLFFSFDSIDAATNNFKGWFVDNPSLVVTQAQSLNSSVLFIDTNKTSFSPSVSSPVKFGLNDLILNLGGGQNDDPRFTTNSATGICKFRLKEYASSDVDSIKGFDTQTLKLISATTGGSYNNITKTFDSNYSKTNGCSVKLPANDQNQPRWFFDISVIRSDNQIFSRSDSYFQTYGAIGGIVVGG